MTPGKMNSLTGAAVMAFTNIANLSEEGVKDSYEATMGREFQAEFTPSVAPGIRLG